MKTNFSELLNSVETNNLVLPDFQRKFVWDEDKMKNLYTSVLCEMPIGSYLTLKSNDKEFSCKKIGAKPKSCPIDLSSSSIINYLIDGQQRITSLFAGFTTYFFREFNDKIQNIASRDLIKLYFLKVPAANNTESTDFFNVRDLSFNFSKRKNKHEYFKSTELVEFIDSESIEKIFDITAGMLPDVKDEVILEKLEHYCESNEDKFYRIPLQFLSGETDEINNCLRNILDYISSHHANLLVGTEAQKRNKQENWKDNFKAYINSCLSNLDLNLIEVENSDKIRAIDIYSNLNQGGVGLSVFDLIMAKVGSISTINYYDYLIDLLQKSYSYPQHLISDKVKNWIQISGRTYDNATTIANVISKKNDIDNYYINVFLNVLSLYINKQKGYDFDEKCVKQEKILVLLPDDIYKYTEIVCKAIDRALFFFETRCGVRKISELNYKAQLTLVAFIFSEDKYWNCKSIHDFLEYWYWLSIFAYLYPSSQDVSILKEIPRFVKYFDNGYSASAKTPLENFKEEHYPDLLKVKFYSDKETLTMIRAKETEKYPSQKMTNYICQFYLAKGYEDFFDDKIKINFLYSDVLEVHHIMTLGSSPDIKIGATTKLIRGKKDNFYNSPLNMMFITKKSNGIISDMKYSDYSKDDDVIKVLPIVGCPTSIIKENDRIIDFLNARYDSFFSEVNQRLSDLYSSLKDKEFSYD